MELVFDVKTKGVEQGVHVLSKILRYDLYSGFAKMCHYLDFESWAVIVYNKPSLDQLWAKSRKLYFTT